MNINEVVMGKYVRVTRVDSDDIELGISIGMVGELLETNDDTPYVKFVGVGIYALELNQIELIK